MKTRSIRLYDTYQAKVREFVPIEEGKVSIYYCGPTVYNYVHIGNMRPVVTFDLLERVMKACGYEVHMISNYTDIDDKIIKRALEEKKSEKELSDYYIKAYEENLKGLNILPLENHPRVSNYIPEIVDFISKIMDNGYAYKAGGDVYFSVTDDPGYGKLSKMNVDDLISGSRVETNEAKKSPMDFALWKVTDDKGIKFDTKLGSGRPGWHTECVVMINSYFKKPTIDIHGGGFDLKFPHHENENAQSWAYSGKNLANYWMHVGFINLNNAKMSKSLGNIVLAKDAIEKYGGNVIRYLFISTYYRSPINFSSEAVETARVEVEKLEKFSDSFQVKFALNGLEPSDGINSEEFDEFLGYLADDLNVANAITVLDKVIKEGNKALRNSRTSNEELFKCYNTFNKMIDTLGLKFERKVVSEEDKKIYDDYLAAKKERNFDKSDKLREKLIERKIL